MTWVQFNTLYQFDIFTVHGSNKTYRNPNSKNEMPELTLVHERLRIHSILLWQKLALGKSEQGKDVAFVRWLANERGMLC